MRRPNLPDKCHHRQRTGNYDTRCPGGSRRNHRHTAHQYGNGFQHLRRYSYHQQYCVHRRQRADAVGADNYQAGFDPAGSRQRPGSICRHRGQRGPFGCNQCGNHRHPTPRANAPRRDRRCPCGRHGRDPDQTLHIAGRCAGSIDCSGGCGCDCDVRSVADQHRRDFRHSTQRQRAASKLPARPPTSTSRRPAP